MAKIMLINIDCKYKNIALHKIAKYHEDRGDEVIWDFPLMRGMCDKIYVSCVFTKNKSKCDEWEGIADIGGSGYNIEKKLPDEIDSIKPRINWGFTTRGCVRRCSFCIVPKKEGHIHVVGDLLDLWDGKSKEITLLDNNILAVTDHFNMICEQAREHNLKLDFNQGLDHRLLTDEIVMKLKTIRHSELRFAFDHPSSMSTVKKAIELLKHHNYKRCFWYVLVGFNTTFEEDLLRLNYLQSENQNAYVQRYESCAGNRDYANLAAWANQHNVFAKMNFDEFLKARKVV